LDNPFAYLTIHNRAGVELHRLNHLDQLSIDRFGYRKHWRSYAAHFPAAKFETPFNDRDPVGSFSIASDSHQLHKGHHFIPKFSGLPEIAILDAQMDQLCPSFWVKIGRSRHPADCAGGKGADGIVVMAKHTSLPDGWRMLAPIIAISGLFTFGWSGSVLVDFVRRINTIRDAAGVAKSPGNNPP
jgi:hypothetical protein